MGSRREDMKHYQGLSSENDQSDHEYMSGALNGSQKLHDLHTMSQDQYSDLNYSIKKHGAYDVSYAPARGGGTSRDDPSLSYSNPSVTPYTRSDGYSAPIGDYKYAEPPSHIDYKPPSKWDTRPPIRDDPRTSDRKQTSPPKGRPAFDSDEDKEYQMLKAKYESKFGTKDEDRYRIKDHPESDDDDRYKRKVAYEDSDDNKYQSRSQNGRDTKYDEYPSRSKYADDPRDKGPRDPRDKDSRDYRDVKDIDLRDTKDRRDKDLRDLRDLRDINDIKDLDLRSMRDLRDLRDFKDKDYRDTKEYRNNDYKNLKDPRDKDPRDYRDYGDTRDDNDLKRLSKYNQDHDDLPRSSRRGDQDYDPRDQNNLPYSNRPSEMPYPSGSGIFPTAHVPSANGSRFVTYEPPDDSDDEDPKHSRSSFNGQSKSMLSRTTGGRPGGQLDTRSSLGGLGVPGGDMHKSMSHLSVGGLPKMIPGAAPPASPLLEPYRGTYQSMPSPMIRGLDRYDDDDDISDAELEPVSSRYASRDERSGRQLSNAIAERKPEKYEEKLRQRSTSRKRDSERDRSKSPGDKKKKKVKTVSMYEAERDAKDIAKDLVKSKPDGTILVDILPALSHDEIIELQMAYKKVVRKNDQGVKLSNHIKAKLPRSVFNTIAYVTALGRWESEGYWANYWYQGDTSKRELLIESLMGRKNSEIKLIKEQFKDKRYGNSLEQCMDKELRRDKFRTAVMMVLSEKRQEEGDVWHRDDVLEDVNIWARTLRSPQGGETAMLEVCVLRSDRHLRECLRLFEQQEGVNFAKEVLKRSTNLVGEVIVHILNGVINKPARDAMLLHHALIDLHQQGPMADTNPDGTPRSSRTKLNADDKKREVVDRKNRIELLTSRVVRLHWDAQHMARVKKEYQAKYDARIEHDCEDFLNPGDYQEFVLGLLHGK